MPGPGLFQEPFPGASQAWRLRLHFEGLPSQPGEVPGSEAFAECTSAMTSAEPLLMVCISFFLKLLLLPKTENPARDRLRL